MEALIQVVFILFIGFAWGSFLNVVIYRLPRDMSLVRPASSCPHCLKKIKFYDNIPVLSYMLLGGKCRNCRSKISPSYLVVEVLTPLAFLLIFFSRGRALDLSFIAACLFTSALIALGFIDLYHQILPDAITLPALLLALVYSGFRHDLSLRQALIGAAVGALFLLLVYGAYYLLRKKEGLGMGDVTMMLMVGAYLGWKGSLFTLILGSFAGAITGVLIIFLKKKDLQYSLPFGTFLAPAAFVALIWGERIINAYLSLYRR